MITRTRRVVRWVACTMLVGFSTEQAMAGGVSNATVVQVAPDGPNAFFVYVNVAPTGTPACGIATSGNYRYVIDVTTDVGKAMVATALTAYVGKSLIDIVGLGSCAVWDDTETISYMLAH